MAGLIACFLVAFTGAGLGGTAGKPKTPADVLAQLESPPAPSRIHITKLQGTLENNSTRYTLGIRTDGALGMYSPSAANFYYGGFLAISRGQAKTTGIMPQLDKTPGNGREGVEVRWNGSGNTSLVSRFFLAADSDALSAEITSGDKSADPSPCTVRLLVYPQSFSTKKSAVALTGDGNRFPDGTYQLAKECRWVYLSDESFAGTTGGAVVGVPPWLDAMTIYVGTYSSTVIMVFPAGKPVTFFLIDYGSRPVPVNPASIAKMIDGEYVRFMKLYEK